MTGNPGSIGIIGLGALGEAVLEVCAARGLAAVGIDDDPQVVARLRPRFAGAPSVELGCSAADLAGAAMVVLAVPDRFDQVSAGLRVAASVCPAGTVLAAAGSDIPLSRLATDCERPEDIVGLDFCVPPGDGGRAMLVTTPMTSDRTVAVARDVLARLDLLARGPGDRGPRPAAGPAGHAIADELVLGLLNRAVGLLEHGYATHLDIDTALRLGCGLPSGPLELLDRIGIDTANSALDRLYRSTGNADLAPVPLLGSMLAEGRLGRSSGHGFYRYAADGSRIGCRTPDGSRGGGPGHVDGGATTDGRPEDVDPAPQIERVAILGSGTMARGIAEVTAVAGFPTALVARSQERAEAALTVITQSLVKAVRRGKIDAETRDAALMRLDVSADRSALGSCDLVIEAVMEDLPTKLSVFAELDKDSKPGGILATTTSSLSVSACADATCRPARTLGLHFFNPAPVMRLVEVVRGSRTDDEVLATARAFCARLGRTTVDCSDRAGFIVNYLLFPYLNQAVRALDRGVTGIEELDVVIEDGYGFPMGPFRLLDAVGLDVSLAIQHRLYQEFRAPSLAPAPPLQHLVAAGHLGRKSGAGFHRYEDRR